MFHVFLNFKFLFSYAMLYSYSLSVGIFRVKSLLIHSTVLMFMNGRTVKFCFIIAVEYTQFFQYRFYLPGQKFHPKGI